MFQMLFPYEDLVKFFQCEVRGVSPRGLVNCGNRYSINDMLVNVYRTPTRMFADKFICLSCKYGVK